MRHECYWDKGGGKCKFLHDVGSKGCKQLHRGIHFGKCRWITCPQRCLFLGGGLVFHRQRGRFSVKAPSVSAEEQVHGHQVGYDRPEDQKMQPERFDIDVAQGREALGALPQPLGCGVKKEAADAASASAAKIFGGQSKITPPV